jgi:hypothetical protein
MRPFQIAAMMKATHRWLDAHGVMPSVFRYDTGDDEMLVVRIQFAVDNEPDACPGAFSRAMVGRPLRRRNERGAVGGDECVR